MCDTFVALPSATADNSVILAKNSDREANEMQELTYFKAAQYNLDTKLKCTYIEIDQVVKTNAILIGKPFWMWGAEMGTNDKGVAIGNEAIWTKMPIHKGNDRLLGMDLVRLALERANTAQEALDVICNLLAKHGQGGLCGYKDKSMAYHNSFLIADKNEAWVLETADYVWVAKKVKDYYAISNGATIGADFDKAHPNLKIEALKKGWYKKGDVFNFSIVYSDWLHTKFSASKKRQNQSLCSLKDNFGKLDIAQAIKNLQTHFNNNYTPNDALLSDSVCAHAANGLTRHASQTTGSMVAHLTIKPTYWFTATASACISIFKPVWFKGNVLPNLGAPTAQYSVTNFWWQNELLHRSIIKNYRKLKPLVSADLEDFQSDILSRTASVSDTDTDAFTNKIFKEASKLTAKCHAIIKDEKTTATGGWLYKKYWKKLNRDVGIDI